MTELATRGEVRPAGLPAVSGPPSPAEWQAMKQQAVVILKSGMAPRSVDTPEKILTIALKGRELAIPPMQALSHIHVVEGKPTMSAELMVALVQRAGHKLRVLETTDAVCVVEGERRDDPGHPQRAEFTIEEAQQAGVAGKQNWRKYPAAMLRARAISALCRFAFADVLMGASYTPEELGVEVNEEGQIVDTDYSPEPVVEGEVQGVEGSDDGEEHAAAIEEVRRMLMRFPEPERPEEAGALHYAGRDLQSAHKALRRLQKLWEEREAAAGEGVDLDNEDVEEIERMTEGAAS